MVIREVKSQQTTEISDDLDIVCAAKLKEEAYRLLRFVCCGAMEETQFPSFTSWGYVRVVLIPHTPSF